MKIQFIKEFTGPTHEIRGVRIPCYHEGPDDVLPILEGEHWHAVQVQILDERTTSAMLQSIMAALPTGKAIDKP